jgi:hypothetical protein
MLYTRKSFTLPTTNRKNLDADVRWDFAFMSEAGFLFKYKVEKKDYKF